MAGSSRFYRDIFATDHATQHLGDNIKTEFRSIFTGNHRTTINDNRVTNNSPHLHISSWSQDEKNAEGMDGARSSTPRLEHALRHGADINTSTEAGDTLLHLATMSGHVNRLAAALDSNPNFRARNNMGKTPLDVARAKGRQDLVDMLEDHEAKHPSSHVQSVPVPDAERLGAERPRIIREATIATMTLVESSPMAPSWWMGNSEDFSGALDPLPPCDCDRCMIICNVCGEFRLGRDCACGDDIINSLECRRRRNSSVVARAGSANGV